jgi:hypothetical protein
MVLLFLSTCASPVHASAPTTCESLFTVVSHGGGGIAVMMQLVVTAPQLRKKCAKQMRRPPPEAAEMRGFQAVLGAF